MGGGLRRRPPLLAMKSEIAAIFQGYAEADRWIQAERRVAETAEAGGGLGDF
jgi:hypothetical protein